MKTFKKLAASAITASVMLASGAAVANDMMIDVGSNIYDSTIYAGGDGGIPIAFTAFDGDSVTGIFDEFGFSQLLATSIYDFSDGSVLGGFVDTNINFDFYNLPAAGLAADGVTPVSIDAPDCALGQCDIDALSPLVPPTSTDNEGFLESWDFQIEYVLNGTLFPGGPVYNSGYIDIFFNDFGNVADRRVMRWNLTGSNIELANLNLFFELDKANSEAGFLFIDDGSGTFFDAVTAVNPVNFILDTNVNPPVPTADQLLLVGDDADNVNAVRQTTLDGSVTPQLVPTPGTLALFGLGLIGLGAMRRRS